MKFLFICFFSIFISSVTNAQSRLGYTEYDIRNVEFPNEKFTTRFTDDKIKYIVWENERVVNYYYFDSKGLCNNCFTMPKSVGVLNYYVEKYNNEYVIVSDKEWKYYTNNGLVLHIKLLYLEGNSYFNYTF